MLKDINLGIRSYISAIKFIKTHKLWWYLIFPIVIFFSIYYIGFIFDELKATTKADEDSSYFMRIWLFVVSSFYMLMAYVMFNFMRYILIILISPVLSVISEKVERILTGNKYKFNLPQLIKDIKRTINLAIRNSIWEFSIIGLILLAFALLQFILGIDLKWLRTIFTTLVAFYYYGFGFIDFMNERRRLSINESVKFVRKHKGFALVLGMIFTLCFHYSNSYLMSLRDNPDIAESFVFVIVILSSILMASIPIMTIVAATIGMHELVDLGSNTHAKK